MLIRTDDEMYRVDRTYLGPKGKRFPFRATYRAYGIWLASTVALSGVLLQLGVPPSLGAALIVPAVAAYLTIRIGRLLDHDRPLRVVAAQMWHEVSAPRQPRPLARTYAVDVRAARWRAGARAPRRWWHPTDTTTDTTTDSGGQQCS